MKKVGVLAIWMAAFSLIAFGEEREELEKEGRAKIVAITDMAGEKWKRKEVDSRSGEISVWADFAVEVEREADGSWMKEELKVEFVVVFVDADGEGVAVLDGEAEVGSWDGEERRKVVEVAALEETLAEFGKPMWLRASLVSEKAGKREEIGSAEIADWKEVEKIEGKLAEAKLVSGKLVSVVWAKGWKKKIEKAIDSKLLEDSLLDE